jgi:N-acetylglucosaminyldiphosphoundecaprenol N-acetyl-beta-D-mannosaminyltransferase
MSEARPPPARSTNVSSHHVLGMRVDATSYKEASGRILHEAQSGRSAYVCVATVHMTMEAYDSATFQRTINNAYLTVPDGRALVWALRGLGVRNASQVRGTNLMTSVIDRAAREDVPIALYGVRTTCLRSSSGCWKRVTLTYA